MIDEKLLEREKKIETIQVSKINRPDTIDRLEIDPKKLTALAKNISKNGVLQIPIVRPVEDEYEVVAGDRRILAVRSLGWAKVKCTVIDLTDAETAELRACENLQRVDLTVIEEAKAYQNLNEKLGISIEEIAERVGKSPGVVKRRLDLLKMPPCLQDAMHAKKISYGVAEALWPITDQTALDYYLGFAMDGGVTVPVARGWTKEWKASQRTLEQNGPVTETMRSPIQANPTYIACDLCKEAERVENLQMIRLCKNCWEILQKELQT